MSVVKVSLIRSIKGKILLYTGLIMFLLLSSVIVLYSRDMYLSFVEDSKKDIARNTAKAATEIEIGNLVAVNYVKAMALAQECGLFGKRAETLKYLYAVLQNNPQFYDCYTIYEPNADGQDASYKNQPGSDSEGRFNGLVNNIDGKLVPSLGVNMETSLYYQGVKEKFLSDSKEEYMITEPYVYEGVMMVEQTYPIVIEGKFAGITGVDRTLDFLSEYLSSIRPYESADFILLSRLGGVIAATMDTKLNTKKVADTPYKEILGPYIGKKSNMEVKEVTDPVDGEYYYYTGVSIDTGEWTLVMRVSRDEILRFIKQTVLRVILLAALGMLISFLFMLRITRSITDPIKSAVNAAEQIASGNLMIQVDAISNDETGQLLNSIKSMTQSLNSLVGRVQRSCIQVTTSATEIAASARQLEATVTEQAASASHVSTTASEISMTSLELANTMGDVTEVASETAHLADTGRNDLMNMAVQMEGLVEATDSISSKLAVISDKANNINRIITTITKVADQTNLLSLNAAIEAEKAGEMGLGFAVVAREIRRLADQTAVATLDIEKMVNEMQSAVSAGVMEMDKFSESVLRGIKAVDTTGAQLEQIMSRVQRLTPRFTAVNEGMQSQSHAAQQISEAMGQLSEAARQTSESVSEFNQATEQLRETARGLKEEVSRFKVSS
jgi:methyl-accepting chemotaxis protein